MSYNKKTFTNCFGEEMTRQIDEVEEKIGLDIDKGKFIKAKVILKAITRCCKRK